MEDNDRADQQEVPRTLPVPLTAWTKNEITEAQIDAAYGGPYPDAQVQQHWRSAARDIEDMVVELHGYETRHSQWKNPMLTPREWQRQALIEAGELLGTDQYRTKMAEARRYALFADAQDDFRRLLNQSTILLSPKEKTTPDEPWRPDACPVTGRAFFMWVDHPDTGRRIPTYGHPKESYTIPHLDAQGVLVSHRYDHILVRWSDPVPANALCQTVHHSTSAKGQGDDKCQRASQMLELLQQEIKKLEQDLEQAREIVRQDLRLLIQRDSELLSLRNALGRLSRPQHRQAFQTALEQWSRNQPTSPIVHGMEEKVAKQAAALFMANDTGENAKRRSLADHQPQGEAAT